MQRKVKTVFSEHVMCALFCVPLRLGKTLVVTMGSQAAYPAPARALRQPRPLRGHIFFKYVLSFGYSWVLCSRRGLLRLATRRTSTCEADLVSLVNANGVGWGHMGPRGLKQVEAGWRQHPGVALQKMNGP